MNPYKKCLVCYQAIGDDPYYHPHCLKQLFGTKTAPVLDISQEDIERLARDVINQRLTLTGVQRKLSLNLAKGQATTNRLTIVGYLGGTHILKPPTAEYPHMPEIENLTMHLAEICRIKTSPHGLIPMKDGSLAYITRRFDRQAGRKIAVEDLCQLSNMLTEQKDKSTAERVGKVIRQYSSNPGDDALRYFELTVFSFLTGNADMHMKNFAMITDNPQFVQLSPAYDLLSTRLLIPEKDDPEELTLSVQGKKSSLKRTNFLFLGENLKIPEKSLTRILQGFIDKQGQMIQAIENSILVDRLKQEYIALLKARIERIA